jgi:DNA-binding CsgD family transcriptional regulator
MDLLARVESVCARPLPDRLLRDRVVSLVREHVPFDGHVFALTDPVTGVGSSPHATVPMMPWEELPGLIRTRYLTTEAADWRAWLGRFHVVDTAFASFVDRYGRWGWLELWRTDGDFDDGERSLLQRMVPVVTAGLRAAAARTFIGDEALDAIAPGVVVLDDELRVQAQTDDAAAALLRLLPPGEPMAPIPAAAYNAGAALIAREAGAWATDPSARVHLGGNRWVRVHASRLGDSLAVSIAATTADERTDLFARAHGLSPRETEVLDLAVHGLNSQEIADLLVIARTTAEDHLKAVLAKSGAPNRQILLARTLGT